MQSRIFLPAVLLTFCLAMLFACGGGTGSSQTSGGGAPPTPGGGSGGAPPPSSGAVTVVAGQTLSGVDIAVNSPASNPQPNAEMIGTATSLNGATATNTGTTIHQNSTMIVLLFGPGLSGNMQISVTGPNDITVSNPQSITATDGTPGVAFTAAVAANAALGARTVVLQNSSKDITTFTGGLEVIP